MSSIRQIKECVDEVYSINEQAAETNAESKEIYQDLIEHQQKFTAKTEKITQQLEFLMQHQIDLVREEAEKAIGAHRRVVNEYSALTKRVQKFTNELHEEKHEKLAKLRKIRNRTYAIFIGTTLLLSGLNYYLANYAAQKYSQIGGMPTTYKDGNKYLVKIKKGTVYTGNLNGKNITCAEIG